MVIKSGIIKNRQRFKCKKCYYYFTVNKLGKTIDDYYVIKALQLHLEGISYREIERLLGVSHVSVMNWVKKYNIKAPERYDYRPTYKILNHTELLETMANSDYLSESGMLITELGDKFMVIKWERFRD
ncbi:MAG: helix-turn-helix domain-containing protein [Fulvivirga sp.]